MPSPTNTTSVGSVTHHQITLPISSGPPTPSPAAVSAAPAVITSTPSAASSITMSESMPPPRPAAAAPSFPINHVTLLSLPIATICHHYIDAVNYIRKIKSHFQGQPDKYKSFLDILNAYQKERLKEGLATSGKHLTEAKVYSQVAKLLENQEDLIPDLGQFIAVVIEYVDLCLFVCLSNSHPLPHLS
jgi:histone deacetylase complex regulatory component SIN3